LLSLLDFRHFEFDGAAYNQIGLKKVGSASHTQQASALSISGDGNSVLGPFLLSEPTYAARVP
jgi:hypothetical protein